MLDVTVDDTELRRRLEKLPKQIPYAQSVALNKTAADAVLVVQDRLDDDFTTRTRWLHKGIRYKPAKKKHLEATVGALDYFMDEQAAGGEREAKDAKGVAVPMVGRGRARPKTTSATRKGKWPGALLKRRDDVFIGSRRFSGDERQGVWRRVTIGRGKKRRRGLRLLYHLADKVQIKPRWPLQKHVEEVAAKRWPHHVEAAINEAIDTAR